MGVIVIVVTGGPIDSHGRRATADRAGSHRRRLRSRRRAAGRAAVDHAARRPRLRLHRRPALGREHELPIDRHPTDKDDTDTALALAAAAGSDHLRGLVVVLRGAATTDRFDHLLGSLAALGAPGSASAQRDRTPRRHHGAHPAPRPPALVAGRAGAHAVAARPPRPVHRGRDRRRAVAARRRDPADREHPRDQQRDAAAHRVRHRRRRRADGRRPTATHGASTPTPRSNRTEATTP